MMNGGLKLYRNAVHLLAKQMLSQLSYTPTTGQSEFGGATRDRTADLLHAMQALSQLSYNPKFRKCALL